MTDKIGTEATSGDALEVLLLREQVATLTFAVETLATAVARAARPATEPALEVEPGGDELSSTEQGGRGPIDQNPTENPYPHYM